MVDVQDKVTIEVLFSKSEHRDSVNELIEKMKDIGEIEMKVTREENYLG